MSSHICHNHLRELYAILYEFLEILVKFKEMPQSDSSEEIRTLILNAVEKVLSLMNNFNNDSQHNSLLHLGVKAEDTEIIKMLLLKGIDVNAKNHDLETPLHIALKNNATSVVQFLLSNGADPKIVNKDSYSSFHFLIKFCDERMINIFLKSGVLFDFHVSSGKQFLEFAVANNSLKMVQLVFDHSDKLEEQDINGSTLLHKAVKNDNIEIVKLLLKNGFNVNATSNTGNTPLQIAVKQKLEDLVLFLLDNNADVNSKDNNGISILHRAVAYKYRDFKNYIADSNGDASAIIDEGFRKILKLLLDHGADVNIKDSEGFMPLHRAVERSRKELVLLLLEKGCDINATTTNGSTPLHLLANLLRHDCCEDTDYLLKYLLENGASTKAKDKYGMSPLNNAVEKENLKLVRGLLDNNPDPYDTDNKLAFCLSFIEYEEFEDDEEIGSYEESSTIQNKNGKTVAELFVDRGFTIDVEDFKDVHVPAGLNYCERDKFNNRKFCTSVNNILNKNEATNPEEVVKLCMEYIVLIGSVKRGFMNIVENLLTPAMNLNAPLHTGLTLLSLASKYGHLTIVEELLKRGADVNAVYLDKISALHYSVIMDHVNITAMLLKNQAYIEAYNDQKQTPLFLAVQNYSFECIRLLLDSGANGNSVDVNKMCPLLVAVDKDAIFSVKILLHYGAVVNGESLRHLFDTETDISDLSIEMIEILFDHGVNMICLNEFLNHKTYSKFFIKSIAADVENLDFLKDSTTADFRIQCQKEIEEMKLVKIDGFKISIYDLFIKPERQIAMYMRNGNIARTVEVMDLEKVFPIFANKLKIRLMKGKRFNRLEELGYYCLEVIFDLKIPAVVITEIFLYLEERDLRCLIVASPIDSEKKASIQYND